jgi:predicted SAM-dependent methyltransferase
MIYMCHILEHIKQNMLIGVLSEMKRVLKTGGVLRLSVPDIDKLMTVYDSAGKDVLMICRQLMGGQNHEYNIHYSIFNEGYLKGILQEAGFSQTRNWDPESAEYHNFHDRASRKLKVGECAYPISLNIEAVK